MLTFKDYLIIGILALLILFCLGLAVSAPAFVCTVGESMCTDLCEPYVLESCGPYAKTATCRTPEGYITRTAGK